MSLEPANDARPGNNQSIAIKDRRKAHTGHCSFEYWVLHENNDIKRNTKYLWNPPGQARYYLLFLHTSDDRPLSTQMLEQSTPTKICCS